MLNDYYARRGRMGFGTIKPFQMNMPEIRPQEEDDTLSTIGGILQGLPGAIGAVKGKIDSTPMPHEASKRSPIITPDPMPHDGGGRIAPAPMPFETGGRVTPVPMPYETPQSSPIVNQTPMPFETGGRPAPIPMPFESKRIGAPPMPFEIAKRLPNFAGFLARGGKVKKNQFAIVGENGPEVVNNNNGEVSVEPVQLGQVGDLTQRGMSPMPSQATEPAFEPGGYATYRKPVPEDLTQYEQPMEAMSGLENAKFDYETALKSKPGKEKWWKDALVKTAQVVSNMFNPQNQVKVQGYGAMKRDKMIQDAYGRYKPLQDAEDKRIADVYKRKQIENIDADNDAAKERIRLSARNKILGLKKFDPNNAVHAEAARMAGLDPKELEGWDDRNPVEKQVAGTTYRLNRNTGAYEPTNLPVDETKTVTDYKVAMPNGEVRTYKVAQKDAANFATQMQALGLRLEEQARQFNQRLKLDEQKFNQAKGEFERVMGLRQEALRTGNAEQAKELAAKLAQMLQSATKAKNEGELDDEQYRVLTQLIGDISK